MYILLSETGRLAIIKEINKDAGTRVAVCSFTEEEEFYIDALEIPQKDQAALQEMNDRRKQEILTSRFLVQHLMGRNIWTAFKKDVHGKPYIADTSLYISLSHSNERSAAILSEKQVGIDLQKHVEKIERIQNKFLNPLELLGIQNAEKDARLHLYWGAKECMFKAYGKKEVDFRKHLFVDYIDAPKESGFFSSKMQKHDFNTSYTMYYEKQDDYYLVYGIPDDA